MFISSSEIDASNSNESHSNLSRNWLGSSHAPINTGPLYQPYSFPPFSTCYMCPGDSNLVNNPFARSFSVIPTAPQSHNFPWFPHPASMEPPTSSLSCSSIYGNWFHRASISPSQASLPPLSPGSEHHYGLPSSPLISPYSPNYRGSLTPLGGDHSSSSSSSSPSLVQSSDMPFYAKTPYISGNNNQNPPREPLKKHIKGNIVPSSCSSPSQSSSHTSDKKNPYVIKHTSSSSNHSHHHSHHHHRQLSSPSTFTANPSITNRSSSSVIEKTLPVPIGIAVARQRQATPSSPVKECRISNSSSPLSNEKCQVEVFPIMKPSHHSPLFNPLPALSTADGIEPLHPIKLEKPSANIEATLLNLSSNHQLAPENLHALQSTSSYYQPNMSTVSKPSVNILTSTTSLYPLRIESPSSNKLPTLQVPTVNHLNQFTPIEKHHSSYSQKKASPNEQSCLSDDDDCNLLISESPNPDSEKQINSSYSSQTDCGVNIKTDSSESIESDEFEKKEYTLLTCRKDVAKNSCNSFESESCIKSNYAKESYNTCETKFQMYADSQYIPTLPVKSAEVMNFISNRGLDRLVDSLEGLFNDGDDDDDSNAKPIATSEMKAPERKTSATEYSSNRSQTISCTDGLTLLSALAEQRSLEQKTDSSLARRYSLDCEQSLPKKDKVEKGNKCNSIKKLQNHKPAPRQKRSESCMSTMTVKKDERAIVDPVYSNNKDKKRDFKDGKHLKKRKRKTSSQSSVENFDPWKIRRSERIFIHESYAQSGIHPPDARRDLFEKTSPRKSKSRHDSMSNNESDGLSDIDKILLIKSNGAPDFTVHLVDNERVLVNLDNLFYAGTISSVKEPDNMYTISLDGVKSQNRHYYSKEDLIKLTIKEIRPGSVDQLPPDTRVCAFWAGQRKCLYVGKIANNSAPLQKENEFVFVEFDDGDKGKICIKDIRLVPSDFPVLKSDNFVCKKSKRLRDREKSDLASKSSNQIKSETKTSVDEKKCQNIAKNKKNSVNSALNKSKDGLKTSSQRCNKGKDKISCKNTKLLRSNTTNPPRSLTSDDESFNENKSSSTRVEPRVSRSVKKKAKRRSISPCDQDSKLESSSDLHLWCWNDLPYKKSGSKSKTRKLYHREIIRDKVTIKLGDCAVFLSTGRPNLPYVGRVDSMWESGSGTMVVHVRWFYHPEETKTQPKLVDSEGALFESRHYDENDVQTISHKCSVLPWGEYQKRSKESTATKQNDNQPLLYYYAGDYEPLSGKISLASNVPLKNE